MTGRCTAAIASAVAGPTSLMNALRNSCGRIESSTSVPPPGIGTCTAVVTSGRVPPALSANADSPSSGTNAAMYTSALTFPFPVAALVITAPPYECPTRMTGPVIEASTAAR
ncbi:hypothetical protein GCM10022255_068890 [Dactylosporangium darangshiense]|uniref:Uncharacterized protein n=1 Tax=Dactylosporangium darangshiense TaxID=579108 RepID=A0ABP8DI44_9ACTN